MKDRFGNNIKVGDEVIYTVGDTLGKGTITYCGDTICKINKLVLFSDQVYVIKDEYKYIYTAIGLPC